MRRLVIRPGAIGDCLCFLPALYSLRADFTELWVSGAVAPLVSFVDEVRSLQGTGFNLLGIPGVPHPPGLVERLRSFDEILSWSGHNQPDMQALIASLRLPIEYFPALPSSDAGVHVSDWFFRQTESRHGRRSEPEEWCEPGGRRFLLPNLVPGDTEPAGATAGIVIHPFSGSRAKNWPLDSFRQLAAELESLAPVRWCASPQDPLPADLHEKAIRLDNLATLAAELRRVRLFVGNDSGITHLAAMLGIPVAVFFGPMDPAVWAPRGAKCLILRTPEVGAPASSLGYAAAREAILRWVESLSGFKI